MSANARSGMTTRIGVTVGNGKVGSGELRSVIIPSQRGALRAGLLISAPHLSGFSQRAPISSSPVVSTANINNTESSSSTVGLTTSRSRSAFAELSPCCPRATKPSPGDVLSTVARGTVHPGADGTCHASPTDGEWRFPSAL